MENLTLENLPKAVNQLGEKLDTIERLLIEKNTNHQPDYDKLFTIDEASKFVHLAKPTLYSKHSKGEIPGVCKQGKRLYFSREKLIDWIKSGQRKSNAEIQAEAENFLLKNKKG